jgi:ferredoxin
VRIEVDYDLCEANGVCEAVAPEVFRLTDDEELELLQPEPTPDQERDARTAVARCPRAALRIVDGSG